MNLKIITSTTRPGRKGPAVAHWIAETASRHDKFEVELLDLAKIDLPLFDEPDHPRLKNYRNDHTLEWSRQIDEADAFIFVTAEYNHGFTAPLKNALDFLHREWNYKPAGFVSYGGMAGGTRAVHMLKEVLTTLKIVPLVEAVHMPFFAENLDEKGLLRPREINEKAAQTMLDELARWAEALRPLRNQ